VSEADFIFSKSKEILLAAIKDFPLDFINTKNFSEIEVPDKVLVLGKEFFGSFEITSATGDFVMTRSNISEAKYIVYASRSRKSKIKIPSDSALIKKSVDEYEKYLDQLLLDIKKDYQKKINTGKNFTFVSNEIFKKLNLARL
jgi:hypothetical protein